LKYLLLLYPRAWRERYGAEFAALVESQRLRPGLVLDILAGAIDARLSPQLRSRSPRAEQGGHIMKLLTLRCSEVRTLSRADQWRAALLLLATAIGLSLASIVLKRVFGDTPFVEAAGIAVFPIAVMVGTMPVYMHDHSLAAKAVIISGLSVLAYLGALLAAWA
jgi:drug/metabolite transporter (DMT)-like permease